MAIVASSLEFSSILSGDYPVIYNEPVFCANVHLALEQPESTLSLAHFGYSQSEIKEAPSQLAVSGPFRILSDEGVQAMRLVAAEFKRLTPRTESNPKAAYVKPRGLFYSSRFVRDLCTSVELGAFLSELSGTPLGAHNMPTLAAGMIYSPRTVEKTNQGWHLDTVNFASVVALHDSGELKGGRFQYFKGTRDEVAAHLGIEAHALRTSVGHLTGLPPGRVMSVDYPSAGFALFMQGNMVLHRGEPLQELGERVMFVPAFMSLDMRYPDHTHWPEIQRWNSPALENEYERHRAWRKHNEVD